jgi:hypothetical protein
VLASGDCGGTPPQRKRPKEKLCLDFGNVQGPTVAAKVHCCRQGKLAISKEDASAIAALTKSCELATERVRILRGRPLPGVLRPEPKSGKKRPSLALVADTDLAPTTASGPQDELANRATATNRPAGNSG